jgi:hypothetical protein
MLKLRRQRINFSFLSTSLHASCLIQDQELGHEWPWEGRGDRRETQGSGLEELLRSADVAGHRAETSWVNYTTSCNTKSSAPEDGQNICPKHVELTGNINKPLLLHLVGCLYYLYQRCTVKQISDNEIYLLTKYIKSVL